MATATPQKTATPTPAASDKAITIPDDILSATAEEIQARTRMIDQEVHILKNEINRLNQEQKTHKELIKENNEKIKMNKQLPYLVGNVLEILEPFGDELEEEEEGAATDLDAQRKTKSAVVKTSTRQVWFGD